MNRFFITVLMIVLFTCQAFTAEPDSPAVTFLLNHRPLLRDGGTTPSTFAAWANAHYLLRDALYLGPVTSLGDEIEAHLFITGNKPILIFWTTAKLPVAVKISLGKDAKLFAYGDRTSSFFKKEANVQVDATPLFIRGVADCYVVEAVGHTLTDQESTLLEQAGKLLDQKVLAPWTAERLTTLMLLHGQHNRESVAGMKKLESTLDTLMQATVNLPAGVDKTSRFSLLHDLLLFRLQLVEMRAGVAQWQGGGRQYQRFSSAEQMKLSEVLIHLLAKAEPGTALRGYPVTGALLHDALNDLARDTIGSSPREYDRLIVSCGILPQLLALESPMVQNLEGIATVAQENQQYFLLLTLRNASEEDAVGSVRFAWGDSNVTKQFHLAAGATGELRFPLANQPAPGFAVQMTGELSDGTPMRTTSLTVPEMHSQ